MLTATSPVEIDQQEVSSLMKTIRSLSIGSIVKIVLLIVVLVVLVKLLCRVFDKFLERSRIDRSLYGFLRAGCRILLYFIAVTIVASSLNIDVTSLIALLSVAGLALSLALQGALSNLAGGIVILTTKPLHAGDYVAIGDSEGFVEEIGMTYTKLMTFDRRTIFIPNSTVTSSNIVNFTMDGKRRVEIDLTASYNCDVDQVKDTLRQAVDTVGGFYTDPPYFIHVTGYGDSAIAYTVRVYCKSEDYWNQYYGLMEEIKRTFDRNGIIMTYPHLNVHMVEK
ncbi:MAG: mechanosensitive ion channel family protein [Oscillospiraceae bacterium]|nr:mechanosensitive ion channel family protein [Oscillospiraceae bacterium]